MQSLVLVVGHNWQRRKLLLHLLLPVLAGDWNVAVRAGGRARGGDCQHAVHRQTGGDVGARHTRRKPVLPQKLSGHKAVVVLSGGRVARTRALVLAHDTGGEQQQQEVGQVASVSPPRRLTCRASCLAWMVMNSSSTLTDSSSGEKCFTSR